MVVEEEKMSASMKSESVERHAGQTDISMAVFVASGRLQDQPKHLTRLFVCLWGFEGGGARNRCSFPNPLMCLYCYNFIENR